MKKLLIPVFFISQFTFGQGQIQHEPERIFNKLIIGKATTEYAKENKLRKIIFYRDTVLSSSMEFDKKGNFITTIGMENSVIRKSTYRWDQENRIIETKKYSPDDSFNYGYYYRYEDGAQLMYKIKDSLLFRKETFLKGENISTFSEYDTIGKIILKNVYVKDAELNWLLETRFQGDRIYVQYRFEYLDGKKYITNVQFDHNGTKISEKRHLDEIRINNKIEHYTEDDERLFRIDSLNENGNLLKMELLDEDGNLTRTETSEYNSSGQLTKLVNFDLKRDQKIIYIYKYDKFDRIELVIKEFNGEKENFIYKYETY
jgi:hypothetical protein